MDSEMSISSYCGSRLPQSNQNGLSNIIAYCQYQSQIKSLAQKDTKRFNTADNQTQISRAMRFSQIIRNNSSNQIVNNKGGS
jgi:hypothetical protein